MGNEEEYAYVSVWPLLLFEKVFVFVLIYFPDVGVCKKNTADAIFKKKRNANRNKINMHRLVLEFVFTFAETVTRSQK